MTDFQRALAGEKNLSRADLTEANLKGANLNGANLGRADLSGVKYDAATVWPVGFTPPAPAL